MQPRDHDAGQQCHAAIRHSMLASVAALQVCVLQVVKSLADARRVPTEDASITCMIRHYVAQRAQVAKGHPT